MIHYLSDLKEEDLRGKKVVLRVDFNEPIKGGKVANAYRIERAMPTIEFLRRNGARLLILSHIDPYEGIEHPSLLPVFEYIKEKFPEMALVFQKSCFGDSSRHQIEQLKDGEAILFENIRQYEEEKANNEAFAKSLASLGDIFVNDAFAVCHRPHASVIGIPKFLPSYAGILVADEIKHLDISKVERPFLFVVAGAKFGTKLPLIHKFLDIADHVFVGGALANDLLKAKGLPVGVSLVSSEKLSLDAVLNNPKLIMPVDVVVKKGDKAESKLVGKVESDEMIVDIGLQTIDYLSSFAKRSKYIIWNGPFGNFEIGFKEATLAFAEAVESSGAHSVVGGGDTLAVIQELNLLDKFTFVSTGGGAMLDYLLDGTLVGIEALKR